MINLAIGKETRAEDQNEMKRVDGFGIERICDTYTGDIRRERVDLALFAAPVRKAGQDVFGVEFLKHRDYNGRRFFFSAATKQRSEGGSARLLRVKSDAFFCVRLVISFAG